MLEFFMPHPPKNVKFDFIPFSQMAIRSVFTSLESIGTFLQEEDGKKAIHELGMYISEIEKEIQRVEKAFPLTFVVGN
jgi:hypothetical protein